MNRKISWNSYVLDEIELVYEKAEENEQIGRMMEQLEAQALAEAKSNCGLIKADHPLTPAQFDGLSKNDKETVIKILAGAGLAAISQDIPTATLRIRLSSKIPQVQACTFFDILNRLEKLDGALNMLVPKWTLELQVPLGGKKGLFQWEMLIMQLYPWITSVKEVSTNEVAENANIQSADTGEMLKKTPETEETQEAEETQKSPEEAEKPDDICEESPAETFDRKKAKWIRGAFDKIDRIYRLSCSDKEIAGLLEALEEKAFNEAKKYCGILNTESGRKAAPETFEELSDREKQTVIKKLAEKGLFNMMTITQWPPMAIAVRFASTIQCIQACTIFEVLNRMEKYNRDRSITGNSWVLEFQLPKGGNDGMAQWAALMMKLYPWLSKSEELSTRETAEEFVLPEENLPEESPAAADPQTEKQADAQKGDAAEPNKKSFWQRLFGK